jgi:hypothetical protein
MMMIIMGHEHKRGTVWEVKKSLMGVNRIEVHYIHIDTCTIIKPTKHCLKKKMGGSQGRTL